MKLLIIPVPLFTNEMAVDAYLFRFQRGDNLLLSDQNSSVLDGAVHSPLLEVIHLVGLEALTTGKPIFIPINHISLLSNLDEQCDAPPSQLVFVLDKNTGIDQVFLDRLFYYKALGYRFALNVTADFDKFAPILRYCDFVFLSQREADAKIRFSELRILYPALKLIACFIDTLETFDQVVNDDFFLFEGTFYRIPLTKGQNTVSPLKANYIQLLNIVRNEDFNIDQVAKIVQQDTALAISLLKVVNSLGLKQKIMTINHASVILGQSELRKWITTAVTQNLSTDKPNEITKLSLIRAKFAENLAPKFEMAVHAQGLFLMGLFSVLDIILDIPIADALNVVQVSDNIRNALVNHTGGFYDVLEFIQDYEMADWTAVSRIMIIKNINASQIYTAYIDALTWYSTLIVMEDIEEEAAE